MLKKVILGIIGVILVVIAGAAAYIYTLDWNKHKAIVSQRLTQITGLKSQINGNLRVEFFPMPKITAGRVSLFPNGGSTPLVEINEIAANLELKPLLNNNFIIKSMTLTQPTVNIIVSETGELNWKNVGKNSNNKSGNVEMSFNDVRLNGATIAYNDKKNNKEFTIPNITASVSAPSLSGPYKTSGKFIHHNSEIKFNGNILKKPNLKLKLTIDNAATGSKFDIDGEAGSTAKGNITFDTRNLTDIANVIFGDNTFNNNYKEPLFVSFQYDWNNGSAKLDNFNVKYSKDIVGNGSVLVKLAEKNKEFAAEFNMAQFNLTFLENLSRDYIQLVEKNPQVETDNLLQYSAVLSLKTANAIYKETAVQNLAMELSLKDGVLGLTRFSALFPGETNLRTVGKVDLKNNLQFVFNQVLDSKDLRTFASIFGLDLNKLTPTENRKSVFKNAKAEIKISGDLETLKLSLPKATIDATDFSGNLGFISNEDKLFVLADIDASKILFDKYLQILPEDMKNSSYKEKFVYQMNLIPWDRNINVEADIKLDSAVYNKIPMEKINLLFTTTGNQLDVKKLSFENFAGAQLNTNFSADNIFTEPNFKELFYTVKTSNFPYFSSTLGIDTGKKDLFKRKIFASQGNLVGTFDAFNLSSVQKFGETEFSYIGAVANTKGAPTAVNGDFELKTNNALNFIKALNFDYTPDVPVTSFTAAGKLKGSYNLFEYLDINAYLGANNIKGYIQLDNSGEKPILKSELSFNKFDADRWFKLVQKKAPHKTIQTSSFINLPEFDNTVINYEALQKANFDIKTNADILIYANKTYGKSSLAAKLKNGVLNVESLKVTNNSNNIELNFILDSNNTPNINGKYNISGIKTPALGGSTYLLDSGVLSASGTFASSAYSKKEFLEKLNSAGKFELTDTAMKGWDLDIIKFDLEQRKDTVGFEDSVNQNLQTGQSIFNKISGDYTITKGVVIADKVLWESPVVDMNMQLNLNLTDRLFTAVFGVIYHNASFSDILKFTLKGDLASPVLELDLSESVKRLSETEKLINDAKENEFKEKREKLSSRITHAQDDAEFILEEIERILRTAEEYKPISTNKNILQAYNENIASLQKMEAEIKNLQKVLISSSDDKAVIDAESKLGIEKSKLKFIPKAFEDNYMADSKTAYDETLNKIIWLYNLASNHSAYYNELTDVYIQQMEVLKNAEKPLSAKEEDQLIAGIKKISKDMEKIEKLHAKIRDDYLFIMDVDNISEMHDNVDAAQSTLQTMLSYTKQLNKDVIDSLQVFRKTLEMKPRDDSDYLVFPPKNVGEIDATKPTAKTPTPQKALDVSPRDVTQSPNDNKVVDDTSMTDETSSSTNGTSDEDGIDKKKIEALTDFQSIQNGIGALLKKLSPLPNIMQNYDIASSLNFGGLSQIISANSMQDEKERVDAVPLPTETEEVINLAEQDIVEPDIVETTPNKAENTTQQQDIALFEPVQTANVIVDTQSQQTLVSPNDIDLKESIKQANNISDTVDKTQTALTDILVQIKESEQQIEKEAENTTPAPLIDIAQYILPSTPTEKRNLRRNPVIAMNIGKELSQKHDIDFNNLIQKTGFKSKKAGFDTVLKSLPTANEPEVFHIAATTDLDKNINNLLDKQMQTTDEENTEIFYQASPDKPHLFASQTDISPATGIIGKRVAKRLTAISKPATKQRYLFTNRMTGSKLSGTVEKKVALAVK